MRLSIIAGAALASVSGLALSNAAAAQTAAPLEALVVTARPPLFGVVPGQLQAVPGSSTVVTRADIDARQPFSIKDALRDVPGLHVVDEDAFGLNLNIGIRGLDPRRTSRTLLLEDGMPIHLGPYSDPTAHYHTPLYRIDRIEVVKGSGQIVYGPQTVGGMINFVTNPAPRTFAATANGAFGNRGYSNFDLSVGGGGERGGVLAQVSVKEGQGVREHSQHEVTDLAIKGEFDITPRQSITLKAGFYQERSNFGEAGTDQARFEANPRGNPFRNDVFELDRYIAQGVYAFNISDQVRFSTNFYYQSLDRASYRQLDAITEDGENETLRRQAGPDDSPEIAACPDDIDYTVAGGFEQFASVCGNAMRPRSYEFYGVEPRFDITHGLFGVKSESVIGARFHIEDIVRRRFNGVSPTAREDSPGTYLRDRFAIEARAFSAYAQNTFFFGDRLTLTPGVRLESYRQTNIATVFDFGPVNESIRDTKTKILPGIGATYYGQGGTTLFAGVHRGFAPPRPDANLDPSIILDGDTYVRVDPELSTNYEIGARIAPIAGLRGEATLFRIDFKNQIVPGQALGLPQTFANGGESTSQGLELAFRADFGRMTGSDHNFYVSGSYTGTFTAKFTSDLVADGENVRGNRTPYAPRGIASLSVGYEHPVGLDVRVGMNHVSKQYTDAVNSRLGSPDGQSGVIPSQTIFNAAASFKLKPQGLMLYVNATNLTDKTRIVSRVNGIHVNQPFQVIGGFRWTY